MKNMILLVKIIMLCLFLVGCSKNSAPSCADKEAKEIVMNMATKGLKETIDGVASLFKDNAPKELAELKISSLDSIRTNKKDDIVKKSECAAELAFANKSSFSIEYTAQYTEDGEVIVEVFGLKKFFKDLTTVAIIKAVNKRNIMESQQRDAVYKAEQQESAKQLALLQTQQQEAEYQATQQQAVQQVTTPEPKSEEQPAIIPPVQTVAIPLPSEANSCEELWQARNQIFHDKGYCFGTSKAQAIFDNAGCKFNDVSKVPLSASERENTEFIRKIEKMKDCNIK